MTIDQYFETPTGKELWEYLRSTNPMVMIFMTRGGYVVDVEFKKFVDRRNGDELPIEKIKEEKPVIVDADANEFENTKIPYRETIFKRPPDPIESIDEKQEPEDEDDDEIELQPGMDVKYKDGKVTFIGTVISINEQKKEIQVEENGKINTIQFDQLISIV